MIKFLTAITGVIIFYNTTVLSQYKIGVQAGGAANFQTVNSFFRNKLSSQIEFLGTGQNYNMGLSYNYGLIAGIKIHDNIEANLLLEYMLKKVRVVFQSRVIPDNRHYLYDLNYKYLRIPFQIKIKKSDIFYYDFGVVNNFLMQYEKDKLYQPLIVSSIKEIRKYNLGLTAGLGFVVFTKNELFVRGETDITPFFITSDYGVYDRYPFKFHNITVGLRYWLVWNN